MRKRRFASATPSHSVILKPEWGKSGVQAPAIAAVLRAGCPGVLGEALRFTCGSAALVYAEAMLGRGFLGRKFPVTFTLRLSSQKQNVMTNRRSDNENDKACGCGSLGYYPPT